MTKPKRILVCPLNWGIGHATRCVPVIQAIVDAGHSVVIAADEGPLALLTEAFPALDYIVFPGYKPTYSSSSSQVLAMANQLPELFRSVAEENRFIDKTISKDSIHAIISDNRYGAYSHKIPSVFISHQLNVQLPVWLFAAKPILDYAFHRFINKFDECWVPDIDTTLSVSGSLSDHNGIKIPVFRIGLLSRFNAFDQPQEPTDNQLNNLLVLLSGPEPQRTIFEKIIFRESSYTDLPICVLRGLPASDDTISSTPQLQLYNHANTEKLYDLLSTAGLVICRPGYSSIMDLICLGKPAFLVPTPGQTEQEYLARRMKRLGWFNYCSQDKFSLDEAIGSSHQFTPPKISHDSRLSAHIKQWIDKIR